MDDNIYSEILIKLNDLTSNGDFIELDKLFKEIQYKELLSICDSLKKKGLLETKPTGEYNISGVSNFTGKILARITIDGIEYLKPKEDVKIENKSINLDLKNSNIGQINQDSESSNIDFKIDINKNDNPKPIKKTIIAESWSLVSENKLVSSLITGLIIEEITFGKIWNFIISYF